MGRLKWDEILRLRKAYSDAQPISSPEQLAEVLGEVGEAVTQTDARLLARDCGHQFAAEDRHLSLDLFIKIVESTREPADPDVDQADEDLVDLLYDSLVRDDEEGVSGAVLRKACATYDSDLAGDGMLEQGAGSDGMFQLDELKALVLETQPSVRRRRGNALRSAAAPRSDNHRVSMGTAANVMAFRFGAMNALEESLKDRTARDEMASLKRSVREFTKKRRAHAKQGAQLFNKLDKPVSQAYNFSYEGEPYAFKHVNQLRLLADHGGFLATTKDPKGNKGEDSHRRSSPPRVAHLTTPPRVRRRSVTRSPGGRRPDRSLSTWLRHTGPQKATNMNVSFAPVDRPRGCLRLPPERKNATTAAIQTSLRLAHLYIDGQGNSLLTR